MNILSPISETLLHFEIKRLRKQFIWYWKHFESERVGGGYVDKPELNYLCEMEAGERQVL